MFLAIAGGVTVISGAAVYNGATIHIRRSITSRHRTHGSINRAARRQPRGVVMAGVISWRRQTAFRVFDVACRSCQPYALDIFGGSV